MTTNTSVNAPRFTLSAAVAPGGTVTLPYPVNTTQATFTGPNAGLATDNVVVLNDNDRFNGSMVGISFGASLITLTNNSTATWPAGATIRVGLALANMAPLLGSKGGPLVDNSGGTASLVIAAITDVPTRNAIASIVALIKAAGVTT